MKNLIMYCISLEPTHLSFINNIGYTAVGLGKKIFEKEWMRDIKGQNISKKNKNYGEYTFHYWLWKNNLEKINAEWIGFCQYRKFWTLQANVNENKIDFKDLNNKVLKEIPLEFNKFDTILGEPIFINQFRMMKFVKKGLKIIIKKPSTILNKKKRTISFHFDIMHGDGNLSKAINLLEEKDREEFRSFVNTEVSFNPQNMFITKSKTILKEYYESLFPWLERCEKIFGFENLKGYGQTRIYTFLAERFMSYWFKKYTNYTTLPIIFYDIRKNIS